MPSFQDSAFIILLGLLLFGPKGVAKIARQLGKLVGEFRRASAEFRMQMEDELRLAEQEDKQKQIAAMQAAAPVTPPLPEIPEPEHPHMPPADGMAAPLSVVMDSEGHILQEPLPDHHLHEVPRSVEVAPLPIATAGELSLMPPATGLPVGRGASAVRSDLGEVFDSIPHAAPAAQEHEAEAVSNG